MNREAQEKRKRNFCSSSESSYEDKSLQKVRKTGNMISKDKKQNKREMHGATVVPEAAFLKHKKLLGRK